MTKEKIIGCKTAFTILQPIFYCIGKIARFFWSKRVKLPWTVHICKTKCTFENRSPVYTDFVTSIALNKVMHL